MSWTVAKLGEVCKIVSGSTPSRVKPELWDGGVFWITPKDLDESRILELYESPETISDKGLASCSTQILPVDSVLFSSRAPIGLVAINKVPLCTNQGFKSLVPGEKIHYKYLAYWLKAHKLQLQAMGNGATFKELSKSIFEKVEIPLPPLPIQKKIAAVLEKADELRRKREEQIKRLDDLLQATFLDMFGDPVTNPKGWNKKKLGELGQLDRGKSKHRPRNAPELLGGVHPLIQTGDVANSDCYITEYSSTYSDIGLAQSKMWEAGVLCITIAANIAKTAILGINACFPDSVVGFIPGKETNVEFIHTWFSFFQQILEKNAPESAQKNINLAILRDLEVITPPVYLHAKFKCIFEGIYKKIKKIQKENLAFSTILFNSLMQRAFKGELDLV